MVNVPVYLTSFIGRESEIGEIRRLLAVSRLLTLTGPGGCGKTRLAVQVAADHQNAFRDGVWWVELVGLSDPPLVPQVIAQTLELREAPGQATIDALVHYLQPRHLLLFLDNCEHLVTACAQLVETLLRACPGLQIIVTSRESLGVAGETVWLVPSLSLPDSDHYLLNEADGIPAPHLAPAMMQYDAIHLFVERAAAALPNFILTSQNLAAVAQVCRQLDGIPLALELAAARVRMMTVKQIAARLDSRFQLLTAPDRLVLPRHQTLRAVIDWSYDLLPAEERVLFHRLAIFAGGFSLEAAEAVCIEKDEGGATQAGIDASAVLDLLAQLVNKSLVALEREPGKEARYHLLETIRHYAWEKLQQSGEVELWQARHFDFYLQLAETAEPRLHTGEDLLWLDRLEIEYDNLRAALTWATSKQGATIEPGLRLVTALAGLWFIRGPIQEGRFWFEEALAKRHLVSASVQAKVLLKAGLLLNQQGGMLRAATLLEEALALYRQLEDNRGVAWTLRELAFSYYFQSRFDEAQSLFEQALVLGYEVDDKALITSTYTLLGFMAARGEAPQKAVKLYEKGLAYAQETGSRRSRALLLYLLGFTTKEQGNAEGAAPLLQEGLALARQLKDWATVAKIFASLGDLVYVLDDQEQAVAFYEECLTLARKLGDQVVIAPMLLRLGHIALQKSDWRRATTSFIEALTICQTIGQKEVMGLCLIGFAGVATALKQPARAARLFGAAEKIQEEVGTRIIVALKLDYDHYRQMAQAQLDEATFAAAWAEGRAMTLAQAVAYALKDEGGEAESERSKVEGRLLSADRQLSPSQIEPELKLLALGPAQVYRSERLLTPADWTFAKPREMLFYLLCHPPKTKEQIGLVFWPDASPAQLRSSLRAAMYHLRRALGRAEWILFEDGRYAFNRSLNYWLDVEHFEAHLSQARRLEVEAPADAIEALEQAIKLYRGHLLEDLSSDNWCRPRRAELQRQYVDALFNLGRLYVAARRYAEAAGAYRRLINHDNLLEAAHRGLMRSYAHLGERGEAMRHYHTFVQLLQDELDTPPEPKTVMLFERLRRGEEA